MYGKRSGKIGIEFANVGLVSLTNLANLISLVILTSLTILTRLAVLASQTSNNNDALGRLIETQIIEAQISRTNLTHLEICLEDPVGPLDFRLRSINIDLIIPFVLNVATQAIVLIVMLTHLIRTSC